MCVYDSENFLNFTPIHKYTALHSINSPHRLNQQSITFIIQSGGDLLSSASQIKFDQLHHGKSALNNNFLSGVSFGKRDEKKKQDPITGKNNMVVEFVERLFVSGYTASILYPGKLCPFAYESQVSI